MIARLARDEARGDLDGAAVTGLAGRYCHLRVIELRRRPARQSGADASGMAVLAGVGGGHVITLFAHRFGAVVASTASTADARVIEAGAQPCGCQVAIATLEIRGNVSGWLARGLHTVV